MSKSDIDDVGAQFARINPVEPGSLDHLVWSDRAQVALVETMAGKRRRSRRRRRGVLLTLLVLIGSGGAAAAVLSTRQTNQPQFVECFGTPSVTSHLKVVATLEAQGPVATCRVEWRDGLFGPVRTPVGLQACVLSAGPDGVFPSADPNFCLEHKLARTAPLSPYNLQIIHLAALLRVQLAASSCVPPDRAAGIVHRELRAADLVGWSTRVAPGFSASEPCATLSIVVLKQVVLLVPVERARHRAVDLDVGYA